MRVEFVEVLNDPVDYFLLGDGGAYAMLSGFWRRF